MDDYCTYTSRHLNLKFLAGTRIGTDTWVGMDEISIFLGSLIWNPQFLILIHVYGYNIRISYP